MRILLTNDDGIDSPGLNALYGELQGNHSVWIVAPDKERSGCSHSVTLRRNIKIQTIRENVYSCVGTPADCVLLAFLGLLKEDIDLVISGPNLGPNLGTDIIYSGTVAAARQAVIMRRPGIAVSVCGCIPGEKQDNAVLNMAARFIAKNLELLLSLSQPDHFLNINFPENLNEKTKTKITFPSRRIYNDRLEIEPSDINPGGNKEYTCRITGSQPLSHAAKGSDYEAVEKGFTSLSRVIIHPANSRLQESSKNIQLRV